MFRKILLILLSFSFTAVLYCQELSKVQATFNKQIDGSISRKKFKRKKNIIIVDSSGRNKNYEILKFDIYYSKGTLVKWTTTKIRREVRKDILDGNIAEDVYFTNIFVKNKATGDTTILNNIHIIFDKTNTIERYINFNAYCFSENSEYEKISKDEILKLNEIPLYGDEEIEIISYVFKTYIKRIEVNSNQITEEVK